MRAEIITIGDEILIGQIVDTNSAWLGQQLNAVGVAVVQITSIGDEATAIVNALELAQTRAELILLTGGLGPTKDDITKHTLANYFGSKLVRNESVYSRLEAWFSRRGRVMNALNARQADLPDNAEILENALGTAQGMLWRRGDKWILSMPGVPYEMKWIVSNQLLPLLIARIELPVIRHLTLMTSGLVESAIAEKIAAVEAALPAHIKLAYLPRPGIVRLRLSGRGLHAHELENDLQAAAQSIRDILGHHVYGEQELTLEEAIGRQLLAKNQKLALAESCTGGHIAQLITAIPGCSAYFNGGVVSYSNEAKMHMLGVQAKTLEQYGAVSEETVREMAAGARQCFQTDYAIAVSGIAGPGGGSDEKPVGTVWIAVAGPGQVHARLYQMGEERSLNIERAAMQSLYLLWKMLVTN